jgi:hypothetical protein
MIKRVDSANPQHFNPAAPVLTSAARYPRILSNSVKRTARTSLTRVLRTASWQREGNAKNERMPPPLASGAPLKCEQLCRTKTIDELPRYHGSPV